MQTLIGLFLNRTIVRNANNHYCRGICQINWAFPLIFCPFYCLLRKPKLGFFYPRSDLAPVEEGRNGAGDGVQPDEEHGQKSGQGRGERELPVLKKNIFKIFENCFTTTAARDWSLILYAHLF